MAAKVRMTAFGWDTPLVLEACPPPAAPTGAMVNVEVEACAVCHRDLIDRAGRMALVSLPITPGHEAVGRVVAVGPEVTRWRVGDRVATMHRDSCGECPACAAGEVSLCERAAFVLGILADGGYATHLTLPESALFAVPAQLPAAEAAAYHCTFGTAFRGLKAAGVRPGHTVLVTGANGGVGIAAVQLARRLGAEVVAVVRDARHRPTLEALGATRVVVDRDGAFHKDAAVGVVDAALDCVGQPTFNATLRALRIGGRAIAIGNVVNERVALNLGLVIVKALKIVGSSGATPADMAELFALTADAPPRMPIAEELPLDRAEEAQQRLRQGGVEGRLVLRP